MSSSTVLQTVPLGMRWPTIDPFLFCADHHDVYPQGTEQLGPDVSLAGRDMGMDFANVDGWNMYHGVVVPGFPAHPHRGFETVTFVRTGLIDHADSLGATARFGRGDVQWVTAGSGIVHSEMFPLVDTEGPNPLELFQIWLNLPASDKLADPHFTMLWAEDIPKVVATDADGRATTVTVIAGSLDGTEPLPAPPHSYASRPDADVAIWHLAFEPGAAWELPPARPGTARVLYLFDGSSLTVDDEDEIAVSTAAVVEPGEPHTLRAAADGPVDVLVLQGRPIGEPVAQQGPFVMNTEAEVQQAFADYRRTGFGGWPWDADDPNHGREAGRFARHADGRTEDRNQSVPA